LVLDRVWLLVGDMMVDGVFRQMCLRPLDLLWPSPCSGRQQSRRELAAVHRLMVGLSHDA
jgi:hypothetical protein